VTFSWKNGLFARNRNKSSLMIHNVEAFIEKFIYKITGLLCSYVEVV